MKRTHESMTEAWWRNTGLNRFADAVTDLFDTATVQTYGVRLQIPLGNLEIGVPEGTDLEVLSQCISQDGVPAVVWHYSSEKGDADVIVRIRQRGSR